MIKHCQQTAVTFPSPEEILHKPDDVCPVHWAMQAAETAMKNSCGRGTFCRDGMKQLYLIAKDITEGKGTAEDVELLQELCDTMSLVQECEMSARAIELYRLSLKEHEADWLAHVLRHRCRAGSCPGCTKPVSAVSAGEGRRRRAPAQTGGSAPSPAAVIPASIGEIPAEEYTAIRVTSAKLTLKTDGVRRRCRKGGIIAIIED